MPREIVLHLPSPPSVNDLWSPRRGGGMRLSDRYRHWIAEADGLTRELCQLRGVRRIEGLFTAEVTLRRSRADLDNVGSKAVLDFAQRVEVIANDKHCEELRVRWGDAPHGCRLIIREIA